jgi:hypothetical protein
LHPQYGDIEIVANPIKFGKTEEVPKKPAPDFNQNTEEVLREIGYTEEDISDLRKQKAINIKACIHPVQTARLYTKCRRYPPSPAKLCSIRTEKAAV